VPVPEPRIYVPELPSELRWINVPFVRTSTLLGRSVQLVWFWDLASLNSLRALPYLCEWHRRYERHGLKVIGVHSPQFDFGRDHAVLERAVRRLDIPFPVADDSSYEVWRLYGAEVWPSLYAWDRRGLLRWFHFGEGEYRETELATQELLREIDSAAGFPDPMPPLRATDRPGALVHTPTPHRYVEEDRSGREIEAGDELVVRYRGAGAAAVLDGRGEVEVHLDGTAVGRVQLDGPGLYELCDTGSDEEHDLSLRFLDAGRAYAFSFVPAPA
jgi:Thioredoxin like C-terminal domain